MVNASTAKTRESTIWEVGRLDTFIDLVKAVFKSMKKEEDISFIDTPADIRDKISILHRSKNGKIKENRLSL